MIGNYSEAGVLALWIGSFVLMGGLLLVVSVAEAGPSEVMLWDAGEKVSEKHYDLRPYKVRDSWKPVPYGTAE